MRKSTDALVRREYATRGAEFGHWVVFFIVMGFAVYVGLKEGFRHARWLILVNVLVNLYPVFVQRYNRPRLQKAILTATRNG
jgi:hypothetical protein